MNVQFKKSTRTVKSIDLDLKNPRLAGVIKRHDITSQKEAIIALAKNAEIISLCQSIVQNGFHPDEVLIVIDNEEGKQNRVTVIEGNRRLSACKILQKPHILKGTPHYNKIQRLIKHDNYLEALKSIDRLSVVTLKSRYDAASYLASKHTSDSIKRWSPYTQGAYLYSFIEEFSTISAVKYILNNSISKSDIRKRIMVYLIAEKIFTLDCWNEQEIDFLTSEVDKLNIGAIIRLVSSSYFINFVFDIKISENATLNISVKDTSKTPLTEDSLDRLLEILARDALLGNKLNTRQEDKKMMSEYIDNIIGILNAEFSNISADNTDIIFSTKSKKSKDPERDTTSSGKNSNSTEDKTGEKENKIKNTPRRYYEKLIPTEIITPNGNVKLLNLCQEAQKLNFKTNLYSSSLMIRAILEVTLKVLIKKNNKFEDLKRQYKERHSDFSSILSFTEKNTKYLVADEYVKVVRNAISDLQQHGKELLNLTNHEDSQILTLKEVEHLRAKMLEICKPCFLRIK